MAREVQGNWVHVMRFGFELAHIEGGGEMGHEG